MARARIEVLTIEETAQRLDCSRQYLDELFKEGKLKRIRISPKKILLDSADVEKLLRSRNGKGYCRPKKKPMPKPKPEPQIPIQQPKIEEPIVTREIEEGHIYILANHEAFKIGKSINLLGRLSTYRMYKNDVQLIHIIRTNDVRLAELYFHKLFDSKRLKPDAKCEWFKLDYNDLFLLKAINEFNIKGEQNDT